MTNGFDQADVVTARMETRFATAGGIADAVLYEGYILYPYHANHGKNRGDVRFQWGVLVPPAWHEVDPSERSVMRTELIVDPGTEPMVAVRLRFLRLQHRGLEVADAAAEGGWSPTGRLTVDDRMWIEWDEAVEHHVNLGVIALLPMAGAAREVTFGYPATSETEVVNARSAGSQGRSDGGPAGRIVRSTEPLAGVARVSAQWADGPGLLIKVTIEVENTTLWSAEGAGREDAIRHSLIAVHTLAALEDGSFCSLFDPPDGAAEAVAGCQSIASYAVLVGQVGATDLVLASPIILYDYPALAPESEGDFHDGCEIDEVLALRILTLTDGEKAEARGTDPRSRAIIDRCDNMAAASWEKLHGTMREIRRLEPGEDRIDPPDLAPVPWSDPETDASYDPWTDTVVIRDAVITKGSRVRLQPTHRADVHDMFWSGLTATVAGVFHDVDGGFHLAVTVDEDPAAELYEAQGRYYYFHPDEIEPLCAPDAGGAPDIGVAAATEEEGKRGAGAGESPTGVEGEVTE